MSLVWISAVILLYCIFTKKVKSWQDALLILIIIVGTKYLYDGVQLLFLTSLEQFSCEQFSCEQFGGRYCKHRCPHCNNADNLCHTMASSNCQIPQPQLNDCWLGAYRDCIDECSSDKQQICNCADAASMKCHGRRCDDPALACYASVHQKCMAGMGFGVDPDRGRNDICSKYDC